MTDDKFIDDILEKIALKGGESILLITNKKTSQIAKPIYDKLKKHNSIIYVNSDFYELQPQKLSEEIKRLVDNSDVIIHSINNSSSNEIETDFKQNLKDAIIEQNKRYVCVAVDVGQLITNDHKFNLYHYEV